MGRENWGETVKYLMLILGLILIVVAVVLLRVTFLAGKKRQEVLDFGLDFGFDGFDLIFLFLKIIDWIGKKIHLKYLGNVLSFLVGVILMAGGVLLVVLFVRSFF